MVRKIIAVICVLTMACAIALPSSAYTIYDGNISSTQQNILKAVLPNLKLGDNYVFFRSGQYDYTLVAGDLECNNGVFTLNGEGVEYTLTNNSQYNSTYTYETKTINSFSLSAGDKLVYSDIGGYPQLEERGSTYEASTLITVVVCGLCSFVGGIFAFCLRRRY